MGSETRPMDDTFFKKSLRKDRQRSYEIMGRYLWKKFKPDIVIDFGCGSGQQLGWLKKFGVESLIGIEPNAAAFKFKPDGIWIIQGSLTEPIKDQDINLVTSDYERKLVLCIEVAEHIDALYADAIIANITSYSDMLVFSAAYPGQGGWDHKNERPWEYWEKKLRFCGFEVNEEITKEFTGMLKKRSVHKWYWQNIRVLERQKV